MNRKVGLVAGIVIVGALILLASHYRVADRVAGLFGPKGPGGVT